jgi:hypothetical protein
MKPVIDLDARELRATVRVGSLGHVLVAATGRGICAVTLGDDPQALLDALRARSPGAVVRPANRRLEALASEVVGLSEAPRTLPHLALDVIGTAFQQAVWRALQDIPWAPPRPTRRSRAASERRGPCAPSDPRAQETLSLSRSRAIVCSAKTAESADIDGVRRASAHCSRAKGSADRVLQNALRRANAAPCGSSQMAIRSPPGTLMGPIASRRRRGRTPWPARAQRHENGKASAGERPGGTPRRTSNRRSRRQGSTRSFGEPERPEIVPVGQLPSEEVHVTRARASQILGVELMPHHLWTRHTHGARRSGRLRG